MTELLIVVLVMGPLLAAMELISVIERRVFREDKAGKEEAERQMWAVHYPDGNVRYILMNEERDA